MKVKFIVNRIGFTFFMFLFVVTFNFVLFRLMPGDPVAIVAKEVRSSPEAIESIRRMYGLDKSLPLQYLDYIKSMATFRFGNSFYYQMPVQDILMDKIVNSLILAGLAVPLGILIGILMGIAAATVRGKGPDTVITSASMILYTIPSFWLAMILLMYFGVRLKWVPISGMVSPGVDFKSNLSYIKDVGHHLIMPVISYALAIFGSYFLIMRSSMIDVFSEDFVLTARAKGLPQKRIIFQHVVPNALLPVSTMVVTGIALMFTGAFSIEILFSWPGMGRLMVDSITRQDYPVMQAANYLIAMAVVIANFFMDILYSYLDPRVRVE